MFKLRIIIAFLINFINAYHVGAFNLSPVPNVEIKIPNLATGLPQTRSSYFGFSIVLRESSILIGAPRAQSTLPAQSSIKETGAIYKCPLDIRSTTEQSPPVICEPFVFENSSNLYYSDHRYNEIRDHQWLGGAMDGGTRDSEPLLVCAPRFDGGERYREEVHDYLHGICYRSAHTLDDAPMKVGNWKMKPLTMGYQVYNDVYFFQIGQMGFSAHITSNNEEYIMGAPGINNWGGSVVRYSTKTGNYEIPEEISDHELTLTGYSVASGYLNSLRRNEIYYVTTSPHENMELGQAFIYRYTTYENNGVTIYRSFKGSQYGEYYGYASLVTDVNGDDLDDVVITAPQYRLDGTIDIGAIYVYVNAGNLQFQHQLIQAPFTIEARFGSTIMNLGDINRDGYNDIAVGVPLAFGSGAVVVYLGSPNGLREQPSQILRPPASAANINGYFGHGLSKGVDIDGNGYNDLAIGAPNNEVVYIYRSYPVINVALNIITSEASLDLQTENIMYRLCFSIDSDIMVPLKLDIVADAKFRRIAFEDNNSSRLQVQVLAAQFEKCHAFNATVRFLSSYVFVPLKTTATHSLINDGMHQIGPDFCPRCAVLDPNKSNSTTSILKYRHGCASEICIVDLTIEALNIPDEFVIGSSSILPVTYIVTNEFEKAFDTQVTITNSLNLSLVRTPSNCIENDDHRVTCDIAKDQIFLKGVEYLSIEYDVSTLVDRDELIINATVTSMGNELNQGNNNFERKLKLKRYSVLEILGQPSESSFIFRDEDDMVKIAYVSKVQNLGPSPVKNVDLSLQIPIAHADTNSKSTGYIDYNQIRLNATLEGTKLPTSGFELMPTESPENYTHNDTYYNTRPYLRLPSNHTIFEYCNQSNTVTCAKSLVNLSLLEPGEALTLNFETELKSTILREMLQDDGFLALFINITASSTADYASILNITQVILPIAVQYRMTPETPLWIYVAGIVSGALLLGLLTFILWKIGFFKRQAKEDLQQLLNEKAETSPIKEDIESNIGNSNETYEDLESMRSQ